PPPSPRQLRSCPTRRSSDLSGATFTFAAVARALDVPLKIAGESIPLAGFAQLTFVAAIIGTILAVVLARRASRPKRTFVVTTLADRKSTRLNSSHQIISYAV